LGSSNRLATAEIIYELERQCLNISFDSLVVYHQDLEIDYPTHAYLLLANDEIKNPFFPYAKIECARYKGTSIDKYIDQKSFGGSILTQAEMAYDFVLRHINQGAVVKGVYTQTKWEYPIKAIREVIRNAVVHKLCQA